MAWIESHQSLAKHKKLLRTAGRLSVDRATAIGHLHFLWWWGLDNIPSDGYLGDTTNFEIAEAAEWRGDPDEFVDALIDAGFIDVEDDGKYLHDWFDYAGKLLEKREKERQRSRQRRRDDQRTDRRSTIGQSHGRPNSDREPTNGTVPNRTVPNRKKEEEHARAPTSVTNEPSTPGSSSVSDPEWTQLFTQVFRGNVNEIVRQELDDACDEFGVELVKEAMRRALANADGPPRQYLRGIFDGWREEGIDSLERLVEADHRRRDRVRGKRSPPSEESYVTQKLREAGEL